MSYSAQDGADSSTSGWKVGIFAFLLPVAVVAGLVYYVVSSARPTGAENGASMPEAVAQRIQKVGSVQVQDSGAARVLHSGEEVFKAQCTACHTTGAAGAPKFGDAAAWAPRIGAGYAALLQSALKGKNNMAPQGGGQFTDLEVGRAVVYMANAGGAKFPEPAAPAAAPAEAASAPAAASK